MVSSKKKKTVILLVAALSLILAVSIYLTYCVSGEHDTEDEIISLVNRYYDAMSEGRYEEGLSLLYRKENTMFDDDFLIEGYSNHETLSHEVLDVTELAEDVYAVTSHVEAVGTEPSDVENYVIYMEGQPYFVIHRTDIPEDMYFWGG